jgi:hypothetical protein
VVTRIGLAIGPRRMVAVPLTQGGRAPPSVWTREHELGTGRVEIERELSAGLLELRETLGAAKARLAVALLPPLAQVRAIELPRARADEIRRVLAGAPERYFLGADSAQAVSVAAPSGHGSPVAYQVSVASEALVEGVLAAAAASGWRVIAVREAHAAWEGTAKRWYPGLSHGRAALLAPLEHGIEALVFQEGRAVERRRILRRSGAGTLIEELGTRRLAVLGAEDECGDLARELVGAGAELIVTASEAPAGLSSVAVAACFADAGPKRRRLLPERVHRLEARRAARLARRLYLATAALLVLAAGLDLWGSRRELVELEARRLAHREQVQRAMELRAGITAVEGRVGALARLESGASAWAVTLARVSLALPRDAHLVAFHGSFDSIRVEGQARRAAGVFEAVQRAPGVGGIRVDAPVRQEARDSGPAVEHFSLAAWLEPRGTAAP